MKYAVLYLFIGFVLELGGRVGRIEAANRDAARNFLRAMLFWPILLCYLVAWEIEDISKRRHRSP